MFGVLARRYVASLEEQVRWLRAQLDYQTKRADRALDIIAGLRTGFPITTALPAFPSVAEDLTTKLAEVVENPEFARVGEIG